MRPALRAKSGSRGKIQQRCCQGRMASWCSQRHTVLSLMVATSPERCASATNLGTLQRASGCWRRLGSSHARALTCTTTSGGKSPGAPGTWPLFQAGEALLEKPLAPQAHHLAPGMQGAGDLIVGAVLGGQQDHLGADNHEIRQRILGGAAAQLSGLSTRQPDPIWALPWHRSRVLPRNDHDATGGEVIQTYVSVFEKVGTKESLPSAK